MPAREELEKLLARVEKAEGPDRYLDAAICLALNVKQLTYATNPEEPWIVDPPVTASIDAAAALMERCLPGVYWEIDSLGFAGVHGYDADARGKWRESNEKALTPPLAILSALLRALLAQGGRG